MSTLVKYPKKQSRSSADSQKTVEITTILYTYSTSRTNLQTNVYEHMCQCSYVEEWKRVKQLNEKLKRRSGSVTLVRGPPCSSPERSRGAQMEQVREKTDSAAPRVRSHWCENQRNRRRNVQRFPPLATKASNCGRASAGGRVARCLLLPTQLTYLSRSLHSWLPVRQSINL